MKTGLFNYDELLFGIMGIFDLHINAKRLIPEDLKIELEEYFFAPLERVKYLNGIVVGGDTLHDNGLHLEDDNTDLAFWFFARLHEIAVKRGCWVRVIKGTHSHDFNQLKVFKFYEKLYDFKIYDEVCVEVLDGMKLLFIPEEMVKDPEEYYKPWLNVKDNTYDTIVFHGLVKEMEFIHQDNENFSKKTPIFDVGDLCRICSGPILAGHIHTYTEFRDQFYYGGSFSRFSQGEEKDKGCLFSIMTKDTKDFVVLRHINEKAKVYKKLILDYDDMDKRTLNELIDMIEDFIEDNKVTSLDLRMNYIDTNDAHTKVSSIIKFYKGSDIVKIKTKISTLKNATRESEYKKRREENMYLTDKSISFYERVHMYVKKKTGRNIPVNVIEKFFTPDKTTKMDGEK